VLLVSLLLATPSRPQDKPIPAAEAARHMTLPEGFRATLFAGEPDVVQPIAFAIDDRGRLWVVECYSYPKWQTDVKEGHDRVLIFEDRDGDGHFDHGKVFWDKGSNLSGIQVGFGGVWLCATPNLLFIPDRDGDDKPDGPPEVVLDGWDLQAQHNVFNSLTWGPDGWLYGCNGILSNSHVGPPGTLAAQRVPLNCGVWRYHPTRRAFEVVAWGTTNPWGLDFDDLGQMFITNCVIGHLWHVVPGAHFQRMYGQDFDPHLYGLLESCADHLHWAGGHWTRSRGGQGKHSEAGGGHAHVGAMVYLGANWPQRYRNGVFMCNVHGNRVNHDVLARRGSGYVAHHAADFMLAHDPWFRGLALEYGPDGGVFVSDWTDTGECHNYSQVDRSNGRIYKITYGTITPFHEDLAQLTDADLVQRQLHPNDWHVRHARRLLQERAAAGRLTPGTPETLRKILRENLDVTRQLRALWALHVIGGLDEAQLLSLMAHAHEAVRGWSVQLALESRTVSPAVRDRLAELARADRSPWVRLAVAAGLQRLRVDRRWAIAEGLVAHAEDAGDSYLPLMFWYAVEPLVVQDRDRAGTLIGNAKIPLVREYLARRLAELAQPQGLRTVVGLLATEIGADAQRDVLRGIEAALTGQRRVPMPDGWAAASARLARTQDREVRGRALSLAARFGDAQALAALRGIVLDQRESTAARLQALETLVYTQALGLGSVLQQLLGKPALRGAALRHLAAYSDNTIPASILARYASLNTAEKADALATLAARPPFALALLDAVAADRVPRQDLSAFTVRQLMALDHPAVKAKVREIWSEVRPAGREKAALMTRYKAILTPEFVKAADVGNGRLLFARTCAACHRLFDAGGNVGPELTGSQRANLDYVLDNVLDPSAMVRKEYQVTLLETRDGRLLTGIIKSENDRALTVQTQNEIVVVPKNEIEARKPSSVSMMPEGLFGKLSKEEVRDLIAYLASPSQVPLPTIDAAKQP
jgi:putative membrane-bound dehydrogenase-like protein